ncbi:unnamed protein product, partial [Trichogramma brassicae]
RHGAQGRDTDGGVRHARRPRRALRSGPRGLALSARASLEAGRGRARDRPERRLERRRGKATQEERLSQPEDAAHQHQDARQNKRCTPTPSYIYLYVAPGNCLCERQRAKFRRKSKIYNALQLRDSSSSCVRARIQFRNIVYMRKMTPPPPHVVVSSSTVEVVAVSLNSLLLIIYVPESSSSSTGRGKGWTIKFNFRPSLSLRKENFLISSLFLGVSRLCMSTQIQLRKSRKLRYYMLAAATAVAKYAKQRGPEINSSIVAGIAVAVTSVTAAAAAAAVVYKVYVYESVNAIIQTARRTHQHMPGLLYNTRSNEFPGWTGAGGGGGRLYSRVHVFVRVWITRNAHNCIRVTTIRARENRISCSSSGARLDYFTTGQVDTRCAESVEYTPASEMSNSSAALPVRAILKFTTTISSSSSSSSSTGSRRSSRLPRSYFWRREQRGGEKALLRTILTLCNNTYIGQSNNELQTDTLDCEDQPYLLMKQEPNDDWLCAGHDYIFDPLESCELLSLIPRPNNVPSPLGELFIRLARSLGARARDAAMRAAAREDVRYIHHKSKRTESSESSLCVRPPSSVRRPSIDLFRARIWRATTLLLLLHCTATSLPSPRPPLLLLHTVCSTCVCIHSTSFGRYRADEIFIRKSVIGKTRKQT